MAKGKKKTKKDKAKRSSATGQAASGKGSRARKATRRLKAIAENAIVADIIAAALVGAAAALKDSKKARQLASHAGDEIEKLSREGAQRGNALWDMALDIGRRSLDALGTDAGKKPARKPSKKPAKGKAVRESQKMTMTRCERPSTDHHKPSQVSSL